ncbi:MAG TPA: HEPN domain-containing protein [Candidatus Acetothermia bacterium]|nr:HEPN domain-containing protein [Candidatus Acetothermia bacterium]
MNEMASRWLAFAKEDLQMAQLAMKERLYNQACFHTQQGAEKALKALIAERGKLPPKTHKLIDLISILCMPELEELRRDLLLLDRFYLPTRYPDALPGILAEALPTQEDAKVALEKATFVVDVCRQLLEGGTQ